MKQILMEMIGSKIIMVTETWDPDMISKEVHAFALSYCPIK